MSTARVLECNAKGFSEAGVRLRAGQCVAFPTETVYGLGANALNRQAVLDIFRFKGRPLSDPLIVHVVDADAALGLIRLETPLAERLFRLLASSFWPGPLTIVARAIPSLPSEVSAGTGFVGVRVPAHATAQALLAAAGVPVAAPSANRFGHVSPTCAAHVLADLGETPVTVMLGEGAGATAAGAGTCAVGIESTVVKLDEGGEGGGVRLVVFRLGGVSLARIRAALQTDAAFAGVACVVHTAFRAHHAPSEAPSGVAAPLPATGLPAAATAAAAAAAAAVEGDGAQAPGMLLTHYAPDLPCFLATSVLPPPPLGSAAPPPASALLGLAAAADAASAGGGGAAVALSRLVVIDVGGVCAALSGHALAYRDIAPGGDLSAARAGVFAALRWAEAVPGAAAVVLVDPLLAPGALADDAEALRDRMFRACSGREGPLAWA